MTNRDDYARYLPKRADANQPQIVSTLRRLGFSVQHIHEVGRGAFDLVVAKYGLNVWVEVKDGSKPPSARRLTDPQRRWHFGWQGMRCVVTNADDCLSLSRQMYELSVQLKLAGINLDVKGSREAQYLPPLH